MAKYTFNQDYTARYFNLSTGKSESKNFKKGDTIEGIYLSNGNPYEPLPAVVSSTNKREPVVHTTVDGKKPTGNGIIGEAGLFIPLNVLKDSFYKSTEETKNKSNFFSLKNVFIGALVIGTVAYFMYNSKK